MSKQNLMLSVAFAIMGTGVLLNLAGTGKLGALPQRVAKYITNGYGV